MNIRSVWLKSLLLLGVMTVLCGGIYPLIVTMIAQGLLPGQANGSQMTMNGRPVGSSLLGQNNDLPGYFHGRPSACEYSTLPSFASNASNTSASLRDSIFRRRECFIQQNNLNQDAAVPAEMLTASASGLDPHISPEAARLQINRIAMDRHWEDSTKMSILDEISRMTEGRQLAVFGEPRVNVLKLNMLLDTDMRFRILR